MSTTEKLCAMIRERAAVGFQKYGVTVDRKDLTADQWLQHSIEEKLDDLQYMMRLRDELSEANEYARKQMIKLQVQGDEIHELKATLQRKQNAGDLVFQELDDLTPEENCECSPHGWDCASCLFKGARAAIKAWKEANK